MKKLVLISWVILTTNLLSGQIINIPADYSTIQQGINAANNGDTVLVATGTYVENINFNSKNITVASNYLITLDKSYITNTIINGNQNGSVVKFESDEDSTAILSGFTLTDGFNSFGGGVFVDSASPKLEYLNVSFNEADYSGGGLYFNNSYSKLHNISVTNNTGNGIYSYMSSLLMDSLVVRFNSGRAGGGIECSQNSDITITNSNILDNTAFSLYPGGGGLKVSNSVIDLQNVTIANNSTWSMCAPFAAGGGILCDGSILGLSGVTIKNNEANKSGGGLSCYSSEIVFDNNNKCSIYGNKAPVGHDISCSNTVEILEVILDTFSVIYPTDYYAEPCKYFDFDIDHGLVQQIDADLYVSANGSNSNSGQTEEEPLLNIQYALSILKVDSLHPHQIHLLPGIYSPSSTQEYFPINIPDYCQFIGSNANEVILNAGGWGNVIMIGNNNENDISGITVTGAKGYSGGGIMCYNSCPNLTNLIIKNNFAWNPAWMSHGGGIFLKSSDPVLRNVLIANNFSSNHGGGVHIDDSNPIFINVTFSGNTTGGINIWGNSDIIMKNSIMWKDSAYNYYEIKFSGGDTDQASISIERSDIYGGLEGIVTTENDTVYWLEGNLNEDPLFVSSGENPYTLQDGSPCIDAGTPDTTGLNLPVDDIIGNMRIWDGDNNGSEIIDMGAYEYGSIPVSILEPVLTESLYETEVKIFPNPFTQSTAIVLELNEKRKMTISIYNQFGKKLETIFKGHKEKGTYRFLWNSESLSSGIYFIKFESDKEITTQKIIKK